MVTLALFIITLILPILGIHPIIRRGKQAFNGPLFITMPDPSLYRKEEFLNWNATMTQEVVEWYVRHLGAFFISMVVWTLLFAAGLKHSVNVEIFMPLVWALGLFWTRPKALLRLSEDIGHAAEVVSVKDDPSVDLDYFECYFTKEADRMIAYYDIYSKMTTGDVKRRMRAKFGVARFFISLLSRRIKRARV